MATYTKEQLLKDVRIILDQNETSELLDGFEDTDQLQTDDIILACLKYAFDRVINIAPIWMLKEWMVTVSKLVDSRMHNTQAQYGKMLKLDFDFLRIVSVMCEGWEQAEYEIHEPTEPLYRMMKSPLKGVRGNSGRPVVFLSVDPAETTEKGANHLLEIYDADTDAEKVYVCYIPKVEVSDEMTIPSLIYQAIVYTTASLYYTTLGQSDMAKAMSEEALLSLNYSSVNAK